MNDNLIGNGSSIFKTIGLLIAGYTTPWLIKIILLYFGLDLTGQETEIMQVLGVIIAIVLSYIDMRYLNTFFRRNEISINDWLAYGKKHFNLQPIEAGEDDDRT